MKRQGATQKIAVTVWGDRVSPVFDAARTLLIAEIEGKALVDSFHLAFDPEHPQELVRLLRNQHVSALICGAISEGPATLFEAAGIPLIPFITGDVRSVLEHYLQARPFDAQFCMPGCGRTLCCRGKIRKGKTIGSSHASWPPGRSGAGQMSMRQRSAAHDPSEHFPDLTAEMESTTPGLGEHES